jgi:hypothetical protein
MSEMRRWEEEQGLRKNQELLLDPLDLMPISSFLSPACFCLSTLVLLTENSFPLLLFPS